MQCCCMRNVHLLEILTCITFNCVLFNTEERNRNISFPLCTLVLNNLKTRLENGKLFMKAETLNSLFESNGYAV